MPILTPDERVGTMLAEKYRLDRILGQGGFGTVYAGVHEWTGRPIATKVLDHSFSRQPEFVARFLKEARAAAKLAHPNVVDVLDMGREADGTVYLVLELLRGEELSAVLKRRGVLPITDALAHVLPIMDALAEAHARGIIHRDLKPANIFLSVDSFGRTIPKLLDFGIAKDQADAGLTHTGQVWGTPHFMSPEQASGLSDVGPAADVWSMGVVLFRCLTGKLPFHAQSTGGVLTKILTTRAPAIRTMAADLPEPVAEVIDRALEPDRGQRHPDMGAFLGALLAAAEPLGVLPSSLGELFARRDLARSSTVISGHDEAPGRETDPAEPPPTMSEPVRDLRAATPQTAHSAPPHPTPPTAALSMPATEVLPTPPTPLILRTSEPPRKSGAPRLLAAAVGGSVLTLLIAVVIVAAVMPSTSAPEDASSPGSASPPVTVEDERPAAPEPPRTVPAVAEAPTAAAAAPVEEVVQEPEPQVVPEVQAEISTEPEAPVTRRVGRRQGARRSGGVVRPLAPSNSATPTGTRVGRNGAPIL